MKTQKIDKDDTLEEMSAAGGGAMAFSPVSSEQETEIREMIRKSIKIYSKRNKKLSQESLQEQKLRNVIRSLILEQDEAETSEVTSPNSTWKNVLGDLLNYLIPLMREKYVQLQTNMTERDGFKNYVQNYFTEQFGQIDNADRIAEENRLAEEEKTPKIDQIKVKVKSQNPDFLDVDDKSPREKPEKKTKEEPELKNAQTFEEIGQQFAEEFVTSIGDRVKNDYSRKLPAQDNSREEFKRVFFANINSWYDIWDENEPVSMADSAPDEFSPPPEEEGSIGGEDSDIVDSQPSELSRDGEETLEEDLFSLLEADLA